MSYRDELIKMDIDKCKKCKHHYIITEEWTYYCKNCIMCSLDNDYAENYLMPKTGCEWFEEI